MDRNYDEIMIYWFIEELSKYIFYIRAEGDMR